MSQFPKPLRVAVAALVLSAAGPAWSAQIEVTTVQDRVADDGLCSLREAVSAVNTELPSGQTPGECSAGVTNEVDEIRLPVGVFVLSRGAADEDGNAEGDLDLNRSVVIVGAGQADTIIENGVGSNDVDGDGDRLFHVDPNGFGNVDATFIGVSLERGDVSCEGASCEPGASAVEVAGGGRLTLQDSAVRRNRASCSGPGCGSARGTAAIRVMLGGSATLLRTRIHKNVASCETDGCITGHAALSLEADADDKRGKLLIKDSQVTKNTTRCTGLGCIASELLFLTTQSATIATTSIQRNRSLCTSDACRADPILRLHFGPSANLTEVDFRRNSSRCEGADFDTDQLMRILGQGEVPALSITESEISKNVLECRGDDCDTDDAFALSAGGGTFKMSGTTLRKNVSRCIGDTCDSDDLAELVSFDGSMSLEGVNFSRNRTTCVGFQCDSNSAVEVLTDTLSVTSVEFHKNLSRCKGDGCDTDEAIELRGLATAVADTIEVFGNRTTCQGDACNTTAAMQFFSADGVIGSSLFVDNTSSCDGTACISEGGGALQNLRRLKIVDTSFLGNRTDGDGGAIHNSAFGVVALDGVTIESNDAAGRGGAIFNAFDAREEGQDDERGNVVSLGSTIRGNRAGDSGGGIFNEGILRLDRTSLHQNSPDDCVSSETGVGCP